MRQFYEAWDQSIEEVGNSPDASGENDEATLIVIRQLQVPNYLEAYAEALLSIGFTHYREILSKVKEREGRLFYIRACATNHYGVEELKRAIARDDWHHQSKMSNNFSQTLSPEERTLRAIGTFNGE